MKNKKADLHVSQLKNILNERMNEWMKKIIVIIIKVNYNYHKKISQNPSREFLKGFITLTILYVEDCQTTTR